MPVNSGDIMRVTCKFSAASNQIQNVFHAQWLGTVPVSDGGMLTQLANRLDTIYKLIDDYLTDDMSADTIDAWNVTQDYPMGVTTWPTLTGGLGTGAVTSWQSCALLLLYTAAPRSQGRKYLGILTEAAITNASELESLAGLAVLQFGIDLLVPVPAGDGYVNFGTYRKEPFRFAPFTTPGVSTVVRSQNRRQPGRGS